MHKIHSFLAFALLCLILVSIVGTPSWGGGIIDETIDIGQQHRGDRVYAIPDESGKPEFFVVRAGERGLILINLSNRLRSRIQRLRSTTRKRRLRRLLREFRSAYEDTVGLSESYQGSLQNILSSGMLLVIGKRAPESTSPR